MILVKDCKKGITHQCLVGEYGVIQFGGNTHILSFQYIAYLSVGLVRSVRILKGH